MVGRASQYLRSNVLGLIAIFIALAGTAFAVQRAPRNSVVSSSIKNGQVKNQDLADAAVGAAEVAADSLGAAQIDESTLPGGTVTSVGSGTGLSGGPITGAGNLEVAPDFRLPQGCVDGEVAKRAAGSWACAADANSGGGGTVTSVGSAGGLTGGPITGSGTLSIANNGVTLAKLNDVIQFGHNGYNAVPSGVSLVYLGAQFVAPADGACLVTAQTSVENVGANASGVMQVDVAVKEDGVDLATSADGTHVMGVGDLAGNGSRTKHVSIFAGHLYHFGVLLNATGDFVGDIASRSVAFLCL